MRALLSRRWGRIASLGFITAVIVSLGGAVAGASGSFLPVQRVPVGKKVFGCVLIPRPPQQKVGPPRMSVRGSVRCDQAHKRVFITLLAQLYVPGYIPPPPPNNVAENTPNWVAHGLPYGGSTSPIRAHHTYRFGATQALDCNSSNGPTPPGVWRTELQVRFPERKHPHRIRVLAAYTSSRNVTC